jgi:hypothetical protein
VHPRQPAGHTGAGLIHVDDLGVGKHLAGAGGEAVEPAGGLGGQPSQPAAAAGCAGHLAEQLGGARHRQVLADQQVGPKRAQPWAVAGCGGRHRGEGRHCHLPAAAGALLGPMLGHLQPGWWQVEHLPGLDANHRLNGQVAAAACTPGRLVDHHPVRVGDLGELRARCARLLARPATPPPLAGWRGRLGQPIRRRRLGGVGRVHAQPALQLRHLCPQRLQLGGQLGVGRDQLAVAGAQPCDQPGLDGDDRLQVGFPIARTRRDGGLRLLADQPMPARSRQLHHSTLSGQTRALNS